MILKRHIRQIEDCAECCKIYADERLPAIVADDMYQRLQDVRAALYQLRDMALNRIADLNMGEDGYAHKELRKFVERLAGTEEGK